MRAADNRKRYKRYTLAGQREKYPDALTLDGGDFSIGSLLQVLYTTQAAELRKQGVISGGMIPKVDCCVTAIQKGVKNVVIMDGRVPHSILLELLTDEGAGTWIREG